MPFDATTFARPQAGQPRRGGEKELEMGGAVKERGGADLGQGKGEISRGDLGALADGREMKGKARNGEGLAGDAGGGDAVGLGQKPCFVRYLSRDIVPEADPERGECEDDDDQ